MLSIVQRNRVAWVAGGATIVAALLALSHFMVSEGLGDLPTYEVKRGTFVLTATESGEVQAQRGDMIMSPRIGGRLKIIHLWPEGEMVDVGDLVLQFDPAEFEKEMLDSEGKLEEANAEYDKVKAQHEQRLSELEAQIEQRQADTQLAKLNLETAKFNSPIDYERTRIEQAKAERGLAAARENVTAQKVVNRVDFEKHEMQIARGQQRYDRSKGHFEKTSVYATSPGIVVYRKIWKPGGHGRTKIAVGDQVWGGDGLIEIPDLSSMQVLCLLGEMDLENMAIGQKATVRLDAFRGPVFHGQVSEIAPMATPQPDAPDIHVFEMLVDIEERDGRLKPGMSAEVEIVLETVPDVLSVPLNAVFASDGREIVYRWHGRSFEVVAVQLGRRNFTAAVVDSGLQAGDLVALIDPTRQESP